MIRAFRYRLYPTRQQLAVLERQLLLCQRLYNSALEQRLMLFRQRGISIGRHDQSQELPALKIACPEYASVHSQVLQNVLLRLDCAFERFFARRGDGQRASGFPRFKASARYDSLQSGRGWYEAGGGRSARDIGAVFAMRSAGYQGTVVSRARVSRLRTAC